MITVEKSTNKVIPTGRKQGRPKKVLAAGTSPSSSSLPVSPTSGLSGDSSLKGKEKEEKAKSFIVIDHPKNRENITHPHHYAIRIGASGGENVEISIDNSSWHACRQSAGYYWYDWHSLSKGEHKIVARMKLPNGKFKKSKITRVVVA